MPLTTVLKNNKELRNALKKKVNMPKFIMPCDIRSQAKSKSYSDVGTAFDFLFRAFLEQRYAYPETGEVSDIDARWELVNYLAYALGNHFNMPEIEGIQRKFQDWVLQTDKQYRIYMQTGLISDPLLWGMQKLAKIETVGRTGRIDPKKIDGFRADIFLDLKTLSENMARPFELPKSMNAFDSFSYFESQKDKDFYLTLDFGESANKVGGASADLIIDKDLIDIKTTINGKLTIDMVFQLIGYAILNESERQNGVERAKIERIGIYFSRHNVIALYPVFEVISKSDFVEISAFILEKPLDIGKL